VRLKAVLENPTVNSRWAQDSARLALAETILSRLDGMH
jgi:hypothetical protein